VLHRQHPRRRDGDRADDRADDRVALSAAAVARAGLAAFVGLVALQHVLRPGLDPAERFVSEYAVGPTQPLQVAAFLAWAAATAACAVLAAGPTRRRLARAVVVASLAGASAGLVVAGLFATQTVGGELPAGVERTLGGRLHDLGTLGVFAGLLLAAAASLRLVPSRGYRLAVAALAAALLAIVPVLAALGADAPGIGQRGFILVGCAWQWCFARAASRGPEAPGG
jgi:hypothetical protein